MTFLTSPVWHKKIKMVATKYNRDGDSLLCLFIISRKIEIMATE